ncbi:MAG: ATP synthase F1 subunit delta [Proteobacteria bacterium]|nr:ATP synthase F1 subunit delta [Pseudomonadota bacterium]
MYSNSSVARKYSAVLFNAALEDKALEVIASDLQRLYEKLSDNGQYQYFVMSKSAPAKTKFMFFSTATEGIKLNKITLAFLQLLITNNRMYALWDVRIAYEELLQEHKGQQAVSLEVAYEPTAAMRQKLEQALSSALGKEVILNVSVNPKLLGGMVIRYGSKMLDLSIAKKLREIANVALS